jgi:hypothetical protein
MNLVRSEISTLSSRFPGHQSAIEKLYQTDSDFKTLCSDLLLCSKMIQEFETDIAKKQHALTEFREIVCELEKELLMLIEEKI